MSRGRGDLTVTALYTSQAWRWGGFSGAELLDTREARNVFGAANLFLDFARGMSRRFPSLRHSLVQRHRMLDCIVEESGAARLFELAAGLSPRGLWASGELGLEVTELDLPRMIARKRALLARSAEGQAAVMRPSLKLVAGDVARTDLDALLPGEGSVVVVAEGLHAYLEAEEQRRLWGRAARLCAGRPGSVFTFDYIPGPEEPRPGLFGRFFEALMKARTGGRSFVRDGRTRSQIEAELRGQGFGEVEAIEPAAAPPGWGVPHLQERTQQLIWRCAEAGGPAR